MTSTIDSSYEVFAEFGNDEIVTPYREFADRQSVMKRMMLQTPVSLLIVLAHFSLVAADSPESIWRSYFECQVLELENRRTEEVSNESDRQRFLAQLGLDPFPPRTDLKPEITGSVERNGVVAERLHFQSLPGLYVTANLYRPTHQEKPLPGLLYLCGHGAVHLNGVSYGNKVHYRHHGEWAAKLGFICLVIDSLQLGEIEGVHHGTHHLNRWWWISRGYTPAGVEAWNCLRAVDYLSQRQEVDPDRIGCTGRSGGGAYSWWIAALDPRIRCAVPVAGITDLRDHIVHGCVSGHCDCMYPVNLDQWDMCRIASLVAPRPLLIANTDRDPIFPLAGVLRIHDAVARRYQALDATAQLGLAILPGEHADTQELQIAAFRWLRRHLSDSVEPISLPIDVGFTPQDLKVFDNLPQDAINQSIDQLFVPRANPDVPNETAAQNAALEQWRAIANTHIFNRHSPKLTTARLLSRPGSEADWNIELFETQAPLVVRVARLKAKSPTNQWHVIVTQDLDSTQNALRNHSWPDDLNIVLLEPRGSGPTALPSDPVARTHHLRSLQLLGETLDLGRVEDIRSVLKALLGEDESAFPNASSRTGDPCVTLEGRGIDGWLCVAAAVFEPRVTGLKLSELSSELDRLPIWTAFDRYLTPRQLLLLSVEQCSTVQLDQSQIEMATSLKQWAEQRQWPSARLVINPMAVEPTTTESNR